MGFATICLSTSAKSSQALHQRGQRLTVSLLFESSPNADESFGRGMLAACVDLCKAFDSVNRDAFWRILSLHGVPPKLINLMAELYSGTESAVRCGDAVVGRVSVASTTARWGSRVSSTKHPEFRSLPSDNSEGTGPIQDRESSINQPRGHRVICQTSKYLEAYVANYRVFTPSMGLERDKSFLC